MDCEPGILDTSEDSPPYTPLAITYEACMPTSPHAPPSSRTPTPTSSLRSFNPNCFSTPKKFDRCRDCNYLGLKEGSCPPPTYLNCYNCGEDHFRADCPYPDNHMPHANATFGCPLLRNTKSFTITVNNDTKVVITNPSANLPELSIMSPPSHDSDPLSSITAQQLFTEYDILRDELLSEAIHSKDSDTVIPIYKIKRKRSHVEIKPNKKRGILLIDTATYKFDKFPAIECEIDITKKSNEVNHTRVKRQLQNIGIVASILHKYPEVRNDKDLELTNKHKYFESGSQQKLGYTDRTNETLHPPLPAAEKRLMTKITMFTEKQTTNLKLILRHIELVKKRNGLTSIATEIELEQLAQLYKSIFWMAVYLHQLYLLLPANNDPSLLQYQETQINIINFFTGRISMKTCELQSILTAIEERANKPEPSPYMTYSKALKMSTRIANRANILLTVLNGQSQTLANAQNNSKYSTLTSLSKSWLREISAQLDKISFLVRSYPYFGLAHNDTDEPAAINLLLLHPRPQIAMMNALCWLEHLKHLSAHLYSECLYILADHTNSQT